MGDILLLRPGSGTHSKPSQKTNAKIQGMDKGQYFQLLVTMIIAIVASVIGITAIVVPLASQKSDAQFQSVLTEIKATNNHIDDLAKSLQDHQSMYERVIDERTGKK